MRQPAINPSSEAADACPRTLIVIPTLNEAAHVGRLLDWLVPRLEALDAWLVVADGGSTDGTRAIVEARTANRVRLLINPARLQSAAVNLAVDRFVGTSTQWLLRIDAHADYPPDYCEVLIAEALGREADSVVVSMEAVGTGFWQRAIALAQNSRFGNGGAAHRLAGSGTWVEHGHHALMRLDAFQAIAGYDPSFSHNEDAELDLRLAAVGKRIWLTGLTHVLYQPRRTPSGLMRQYLHFGRGRARTMLKHRRRPGARQVVVVALGPLLAFAVLAPLHVAFAAPFVFWLAACLAAGTAIASTTRDWRGLAAGAMAGLMQAAWSVGWWAELCALRRVHR